jgi:Rrf2 family nitric oxide-sensitive transcriptional repressor
MRLTTFSDYTLRTLTYLALHPDRFVTIAEIASAYSISANHLMKVVQTLAGSGDVVTLRGPHGGLRLSRPADKIRLGDVIRRTEPESALTACFGTPETCVVQTACVMSGILSKALEAFMGVLDSHTLADLVAEPESLVPLLGRNLASNQACKCAVNSAAD